MPDPIIAEQKPTESSAPAAKNPFAAFSEIQTEAVTKEPVKTETPPAEAPPAAAVEKKPGDEGYVEKPAPKEGEPGYVKSVEKPVEGTPPTAELTPFKFADELKIGTDISFQTLATEYGFEVKENTAAAFNEGLKNHLKTVEQKAAETNFLGQLEKQPAHVQEAYLLAANNIPLSEIDKPTQQIDSLIALNNFDLAKAELEALGRLSPAAIEVELQRLTESGELDGYAATTRNSLTEQKQNLLKERTEFFNGLMEKEKTRQTAESTQRITSVEKALSEISDFMGIPVNAEIQKGFVQRLKLGNYNDLLNDPKAIAMAIVHKEMGPYALNELKQKTAAPIIEKQIREAHNVPTHQNAGAIVEQPKPTGPFAAFM